MDHPKPYSTFLVAALFAAITAGPAARAQVAQPSPSAPSLGFADDRIVVRLTPAASRAAFVPSGVALIARARLGVPAIDRALAAWPGAWLEPEFRGDAPPPPGSNATDFAAFYVLHLPPGATRDDAISRIRAVPDVADAHPIGFAPVAAVPNDSLWSHAYYFYQPSRRDIHAPEAWDLTQGDTSIVVAIIDTGVVPYHPDLGGSVAGGSGQFWTNWAEMNGLPGVDDDHNGFVDDFHGWDFVSLINDVDAVPGEDWQDEDNDPNDYIGHGTCVAGLVGALSDNTIGVTGTAWKVRLMPLRVVWSSPRQPTGIVDMSYVTAAIRYATRMHANVINLSLGNVPASDLDLALKAASDSGIVVVVAAGNNGTPNYVGDYFPDAIVVAATDENDMIPVWSNRGPKVDLAAPGVDMATTITARPGADSLGLRGTSYVTDLAGTSFATPVVSGAVALTEAMRIARGIERLSPRQIGTVLRYTADDISGQNPGNTGYGAGRLNMDRAVTAASRIRAKRLRARTVSSGVTFRTNRGDSLLALPTEDGRLEFYDALTLDFVSSAPLGGVPVAPLAAADLGAKHGVGIFASLGDHLAGFGAGDAPLPGWPVTVPVGGLVGNPVLGDLDGDGSLEIVCLGTSGRIWAWTAVGAQVPGFPIHLGPAADVYAPLALSDLDGQPGVEIVAAQTNGQVDAFRRDGSEVPGWPASTDDALPAGPVVGTLASQPIVVVAGGRGVHRITPDGTELAEIPRPWSEVAADPALGDLDDDGIDDVVISGSTGALAIGLDGTSLTGWPVLGNSPLVGAPLIGFFAASDTPAVVVPTGARLRGLSAAAGPLPDFLAYPDGDMTSVLATGTADSIRLIQGTSNDSLLYVYEMPSGRRGSASAWPTQRGGFARTGSRRYAPPMGEGDAIPPITISDLHARALPDSTANVLSWIAPDDEGPARGAADYDLRAANDAATLMNRYDSARRLAAPPASGPAGTPESLMVTQLGVTDRWFAIRSRDASGNWSAISAPVERQYLAAPPPPPPPEPTTLALALGRNPSRLPLSIAWQVPGSGARALRIFDLGGRMVRSLALAGQQGTMSWDGKDEHGGAVPSGVYVATLVSGPERITRRFVLLR